MVYVAPGCSVIGCVGVLPVICVLSGMVMVVNMPRGVFVCTLIATTCRLMGLGVGVGEGVGDGVGEGVGKGVGEGVGNGVGEGVGVGDGVGEPNVPTCMVTAVDLMV